MDLWEFQENADRLREAERSLEAKSKYISSLESQEEKMSAQIEGLLARIEVADEKIRRHDRLCRDLLRLSGIDKDCQACKLLLGFIDDRAVTSAYAAIGEWKV